MRGSGTRQRPLSLLQKQNQKQYQNQNQKQYQNQKQNQKQKQNQNQKQPDLPPFAAFAAAGAGGLLIFEDTLI